MRPAVRSLLLFVTGWSVVCVLLFLFLGGFFTSWDGRAVSVRSSDAEQAVYNVLIVADDGSRFEADWPAYAVEGLKLQIDPLALPPKNADLPEGLPRTVKAPWTMSFTVTPDGGTARVVATTSAQAAAIALLALLLGIGVRNMMVAGSPISIEPRGVTLPKAQAAAGQIAPGTSSGSGGGRNRAGRPKKGPPPGKRRRGGGRRR